MQLLVFYRPGCVTCMAMRLMIRRVGPQYPDLQVEEIDTLVQSDEAREYKIQSAPAIVVDGELVAARHVKEADLRRALLRQVAPAARCRCGCGCLIRARLRPYRLRPR